MSDREKIEKYIKRVKNGDADAYGRVYTILAPEIYRFCLMKTMNIETAEDITSEAFTRAFTSIHKYRSDNFRAYVYAITRNLCVDYFRSKSREAAWEDGFEPEDTKKSVIDEIYRYETQKTLQRALRRIPEAQAEVIVLRFTHDLGIDEVARAMNRSQVWVRVNQYRALRKLKKVIENE